MPETTPPAAPDKKTPSPSEETIEVIDFEEAIERLNKQFLYICAETQSYRLQYDAFGSLDLRPVKMHELLANFVYKTKEIPIADLTPKEVSDYLKQLSKPPNVANLWLSSPDRREYERRVFNPYGTHADNEFNTWRGYAFADPQPGDTSRWWEWVREIICLGNEEHTEWIKAWIANALQYPDVPAGVAIALTGRQGAGKSFFAKLPLSLIPQHAVHTSSSLSTRFNYHLEHKVFVFADEAVFGGDRREAQHMKTFITEDRLSIERKGVDCREVKNVSHVILASNDDKPAFIEADDRRYAVFGVSSDRVQDRAFYQDLATWLDEGGREALLHELLHYDLAAAKERGIDPFKPPATQGKRDIIYRSMNDVEGWWLEVIERGYICEHEVGWGASSSRGPVFAPYDAYEQYKSDTKTRYPAAFTDFKNKLLRLMQCEGEEHKQFRTRIKKSGGGTASARSCWHIPSRLDCIKSFNKLYPLLGLDETEEPNTPEEELEIQRSFRAALDDDEDDELLDWSEELKNNEPLTPADLRGAKTLPKSPAPSSEEEEEEEDDDDFIWDGDDDNDSDETLTPEEEVQIRRTLQDLQDKENMKA